MKRKFWLNLHLALVGLFLPLLIIFPLSGSLYLLGEKGEVKKTDLATIETEFTKDPQMVREILKRQKIDFDFEYIKSRGETLILRPATRDHLEIHKTESGVKIVKVEPNLIKILQELHFGHGPRFMKGLQIFCGAAFFLIIISGFVLSLGMKKFKPMLIGSTAMGIVLMLLAWNIF